MKYDTTGYPGITMQREGDVVRILNESTRVFVVHAGIDRTIRITPGTQKNATIMGETFSCGWEDPVLDPANAWPFPATSSTEPELVAAAVVDETFILGSSVLAAVFPDVLVNMAPDTSGNEEFGQMPFEGLLASAEHVPAEMRHQYRELVLGDVVAYAHGLTMLTAAEWNALAEPERERQISEALTLIRSLATPMTAITTGLVAGAAMREAQAVLHGDVAAPEGTAP